MKKSAAAVLVVLAAVITLSSCSVYTCPTYAKNHQKKEIKDRRI